MPDLARDHHSVRHVLRDRCYGPEAALFADLFDARSAIPASRSSTSSPASSRAASRRSSPPISIEANGGQPWYLCGYVVFAALVSMLSALAIGRIRLPDVAGTPAPRTT